MFFAKGVFHIRLFGTYSLKDKRRVLKSLMSRLRQNLMVSCAEVGENDVWGIAVLAVAFVSSSQDCVKSVMDKCLKFIENNIDGEVFDHDVEIIT